MNEQNTDKSILKILEGVELAGITFIRGYIQFLFDGPLLNVYSLLRIKSKDEILSPKDHGFYDTLCSLVGERIVSIQEIKEKERITILFENDIELIVSLKQEDRNCVEAAIFQKGEKGEWEVW